MNNPYKVLGIESSASDEEVKSAYRNLAKKYHPDNYTNSPLADLAEEKMKEINEAYSIIMKRRQGKKSDSSYSSTGSSYYDPALEQVRMKIEEGKYSEAEQMLLNIGKFEENRSAEWYFLLGKIREQRGWYFDAYKQYSTAYRMEPNNQTYYNNMKRMQGKQSEEEDLNRINNTTCLCCSSACLADCCCETCGSRMSSCC